MSYPIAIIAHGGAAKYPDDMKKCCVDGVEEAINVGYKILKNGGNAVDAVKETVIMLENNPLFNAGYGSCLNENGKIEMDAMIMNGSTYKYGAVVSIDCVYNPVKLAYSVMKETPHCILSGQGATEFAKIANIPLCTDINKLVTKSQLDTFHKTPSFKVWLKNDMASEATIDINTNPIDHDTVGCVALDCYGTLACATSTGGINGKMVGRIGDSAIIGGGGYANEYAAAVATGHGESLLKVLACYSTVNNIEHGDHPCVSSINVLNRMKNILQGRGGIISINKSGEIGYAYTTEYMPWAAYNKEGKLLTSLNTYQ